MNKNILLVVVVALILGSIFYIDSKKAHPTGNGVPVETIPLPSIDVPATTTPVTATSTPAAPVTVSSRAGFLSLAQKAAKYERAKEITTPDGFVNTPSNAPIKISDYIGKKVVLIDFWTYSCINCQRTVPYLQGWYTKYGDEGLVIIGIHTPEFEFEKDYTNVSNGVKNLGITFPVVLDNDYSTWNAYANHYWPHKYLIDIDGYITYDHIGEGGYPETEVQIQNALKERAQVLHTGQKIATGTINPLGATTIDTQSPETYFGSARNEFLGNGMVSLSGVQTLTLPTTALKTNTLYLGGMWDMEAESATTVSDTAQIEYSYSAKNVYLVAGAKTPVTLKVFQDNVLVNTITVGDPKLYTLVQNGAAQSHTLRLEATGKGLEAFTFTFG